MGGAANGWDRWVGDRPVSRRRWRSSDVMRRRRISAAPCAIASEPRGAIRTSMIPQSGHTGDSWTMPDYRRGHVPVRTLFFVVNVLDRSSRLHTDDFGALRAAIGDARARAPFHISAWAVQLEHLEFTELPEGDWGERRRVRRAERVPTCGDAWRCAYAPTLAGGRRRALKSPHQHHRGRRQLARHTLLPRS